MEYGLDQIIYHHKRLMAKIIRYN